MHHTVYLILLLSAFCEVNCSSRHEGRCLDYYQTGNDFDLSQLIGKWHAVYLWPAARRQRDYCEVLNFKKLTEREVISTINSCNGIRLSGETVIQATYKNIAGQPTSVTYYGEEEVKNLFRSCDRVQKYIFLKINDGYVLGINCSKDGRGILLSRVLPTSSQVQSLVDSIEIMNGRDGGPDCKLP